MEILWGSSHVWKSCGFISCHVSHVWKSCGFISCMEILWVHLMWVHLMYGNLVGFISCMEILWFHLMWFHLMYGNLVVSSHVWKSCGVHLMSCVSCMGILWGSSHVVSSHVWKSCGFISCHVSHVWKSCGVHLVYGSLVGFISCGFISCMEILWVHLMSCVSCMEILWVHHAGMTTRGKEITTVPIPGNCRVPRCSPNLYYLWPNLGPR